MNEIFDHPIPIGFHAWSADVGWHCEADGYIFWAPSIQEGKTMAAMREPLTDEDLV
jgi:hypothetical protein